MVPGGMVVMQQGNNVMADPGKQSLYLQHPAGVQVLGQQGWVAGSQAGGAFRGPGAPTPQAPMAVYQQQPQQVRIAPVSVSTAQLPQHPQMLVSGGTQVAMLRQAAPQALSARPAPSAAPELTTNKQQVVYVNINGALQRGIVQNGAVYLLANDNNMAAAGPGQAVGAMPHQSAGMHQMTGSKLMALKPQQMPQQQVMLQQVLAPGHMVALSGAMVASHAGVQLPAPQQLQPQSRMCQARPMPIASLGMTGQLQQQQQQPVVLMTPATGPNMAARPAAMPASAGISVQARPQQQQQVLMPLAQGGAQAVNRLPAAQGGARPPGQSGGNMRHAGTQHTYMPANSVSANTASLLPRMAVHSAGAAPQGVRTPPSHGQPMTIAAALAALPSNPAGAPMAPASSELSSPVAPPGTPGMTSVAALPGSTNGTIGAVINKLGAPPAGVAAGAVGGRMSITPTGSSPLTSQPGTPSRSNSIGANSSTSSTSGSSMLLPAAEAAAPPGDEGKQAVMRMFARTFIETGIGLEQAASMIQASDRDLLAAAFAAEAAGAVKASGAGAQEVPTGDAVGAAMNTGGIAGLGGEQISLPAAEGRASGPTGLQQLANITSGTAFDTAQDAASGLDTASLGSWGFSLFSNVASDIGSNQGSSSLGGTGEAHSLGPAAHMATAAATDDVSTATLFANLNL